MSARWIRWSRVRPMIRLLGEVRELGTSTEAARQHIVQTMFHQLGAVLGGVVHDLGYRLDTKDGVVNATLAGFDSTSISVFDAHRIHGSDFNPVHRELIRKVSPGCAGILTLSDDCAVTAKEWDRAPWVVDYARPVGVSRFISAVRVLSPTEGHAEGMGYMREVGDKPFSQEDHDLLELFLLESGRLFGSTEQQRGLTLAPRVKETLACLLTGASDKEIAQQLGISHHTVRDYVKTLFRTYGVSSRSALIAQCLRAPSPKLDSVQPA